jgi:hypothetical protein
MELMVREFTRILTDTNELMGWAIPEYVIAYESRIFASKVEQPNWQPEPSYAERYLSIRTSEQALNLANTCWFTRSVFPELGSRKGINESYYVQLGQSCYDRALRDQESPTVEIMRDHFEFLAETAYTAIRHYGKFRSMWE